MVYNITMNQNKNLSIGSSAIYKGENNADIIRFIIPKIYGDYALQDCIITLHYFNADNMGNVITLNFNDTYYDNTDFIMAQLNITNELTYLSGKIILWLEITKSDKSLVMKTATTSLFINNHYQVTDYISEQQLGIFEDWLIKMEQIQNTCMITLQKAENAVKNTADIAQAVFDVMEKWEAEHGS